MPTKRSIEEAKTYIEESIKLWEGTNQEKQIISLSNWAEKYRIQNKIAFIEARIKALKKDNKSYELIINRNNKLGVDYPVIKAQMEQNFEEIKELESSFIRKERKRRKSSK